MNIERFMGGRKNIVGYKNEAVKFMYMESFLGVIDKEEAFQEVYVYNK